SQETLRRRRALEVLRLMRVDLFDFELPAASIAARPARPRDSARLLHVAETIADRALTDLPRILGAGDVMVFNDTRVIPARLLGSRGQVPVELLLLRQLTPDTWAGLARPGKRLKPGQVIEFPGELTADVIAKDGGGITVRFSKSGAALRIALEAVGHVPLPPYI